MVCRCFSLRVTSLSFTVGSMSTFLALAVPVTPPLSCHVLLLWRGRAIICSHFGVCMWREGGGGVGRPRKPSRIKGHVWGSRGLPQKTAAPHCLCLSPGPDSSQKYEASRDLCPGEKGQSATHLRSLFVFPPSLSLTPTHKEERKPFVFALPLIQPPPPKK